MYCDDLLQYCQVGNNKFMIGLKKIRKLKNLNQQKVALDLHISREALSHYENGKREPSLALLLEMARYFKVSIEYLITGENII